MDNPSGVAPRQKILEEAYKAVSVDRNSTYGNPEDNFRTIADLWNVYWFRRHPDAISRPFEPVDVAMFTALIKVARIANDPTHRDNYVDLAGYAACGWDTMEPEGSGTTTPLRDDTVTWSNL